MKTPEAPQKIDGSETSAAPRRFKRLKPILFLGAIGFICIVMLGLASRSATTNRFQKVADAAAQFNVQVVSPEQSAASTELQLPGQTHAYYEAPIYAQTTGYLKKWYYDIGAKVKAGDILGEIDTPEVDQELSQARATLAMAKAQLTLAEANYHEAQDLFQTKVTTQRDLDTMQSNYLVLVSTVNGDADAVQRLQALENFKFLRAPFDGIVINRSTDVGDLIVSGSGLRLFIVDQQDPLRVYVHVPENFAREVQVGTKADLSFDEFPGRVFPATVVTTSDAVDPTNRTHLVELHVPNPANELWPGAYTEVHFHLKSAGTPLQIPANTLLFRNGASAVAVVKADGKVEIRNVEISKDLGARLEIAKGLSLADQLIVNPSDSLNNGMEVHVVEPDQNIGSMAEN
ncbi:MAG TPA: efflux RND transporter periplasmic adaptor subunit [Chthoniobacterales bacterium]|jgi:RND family efflux transporter MFP subunit|nr:efflux RND transporter periplasmic adaptor subunit [Chthoniobacterales bacterium]